MENRVSRDKYNLVGGPVPSVKFRLPDFVALVLILFGFI